MDRVSPGIPSPVPEDAPTVNVFDSTDHIFIRPPIKCYAGVPPGTLAVGVQITPFLFLICLGVVFKVEYLILGDDTALNGIRLHCIEESKATSDSYHDYASVQSDVGSWGLWTTIKWCPSGFLTAFQLQVESPQGDGDDTAANKIMFKCSQGMNLVGEGTKWGDWGDWSQTCDGKGICGLQTLVEGSQGRGDDTALNDVRMFCCD